MAVITPLRLYQLAGSPMLPVGALGCDSAVELGTAWSPIVDVRVAIPCLLTAGNALATTAIGPLYLLQLPQSQTGVPPGSVLHVPQALGVAERKSAPLSGFTELPGGCRSHVSLCSDATQAG